MTSVEIVPEIDVRPPDAPRLLVGWSSPWEEFKTALGPALRRSPKALAGEARTGLFPYRGLLVSWIAEALVLWLVIVLPSRLESLRPYSPPPLPKYDVLYYYGDELPQTQDNAGAEAGRSGLSGGSETHHRSQAIRVARGDGPTDKVVDAPKLNLPRSDSAVANLLAFKPLAGPPPTEGLHSSLVAPALPSSVVAPTPELNSTFSRTANGLTAPVVAPAPNVSRANTRAISGLSSSVVAPAPEVTHDKLRSLAISPSVVSPAPSDAQRDLASSRVPVTQTTNVVAPPVSAPQRDLNATAKLSLPAPAVIAPPPSQVSRDLNSWGGSAAGNIRALPVPPPPSAGTSAALNSRSANSGFTPQIVPPPVNASAAGLQGTGKRGPGAVIGSSVVVPPPVATGALQAGQSDRRAGTLLGSTEVVPPPPGIGGGKFSSGSGLGVKGNGSGSMLDLGSAAAAPSANSKGTSSTGSSNARASSSTQSGVVVSSQPGTKVGLPNSPSGGAIAMSTSGTSKSGIGGSGGGTGIGKGTGPGSGLSGDSSGAAKEGTGRGSDPSARAGISPYPGPGGAGRGTTGSPAMPGVSVQGGTTITLPSFGPTGSESTSGGGHSSLNNQKRSGITIVATSRSGGVFGGNYYGALKGDRVYSIYIDTSLGTAVMQFADPASAAHPYAEDLTAPEPIRKEIPQGIRTTHVVFVGILGRSGELKDLKVLEPGAAEATSKLLAVLPNWKFRPAFRGNEAVEVNVILGFGVDTR